MENVLLKVRKLQKEVGKIPVSLKKDQQGIPTRDKRVINTLVNNIYKELVIELQKQREEL